MTLLRFIPKFEDPDLLQATAQYKEIWTADGERIEKTFKKYTNLSLCEERIAVIVYEGVSFSGRNPDDLMRLRASYTEEVKKGTLIHELAHRLTFNLNYNAIVDEHEIINLFLYDVWVELYGTDFADQMVKHEKNLNSRYADAWDKTLVLPKEARQEKWQQFLHSHLQNGE